MALALATADPKFKYELASRPGGENIKACFSCGVCTAGCPVTEVDPQYNPRRIIRMVLLGLRKEVLSSEMIWLCASCYACYAHCPQNVKFAEVVKALRQMAVEQGYAHPSFLQNMRAIDRQAHLFHHELAREAARRRREELNVDVDQLSQEVLGKLQGGQ